MANENIKQKNPGWINLLMSRLKSLADKEIAVGYPKGKAQAYPDGESVAQVAYDNVHGTHAPVRDFMSYADAGIRDRTRPILREVTRQSNLGNKAGAEALQEAAGLAATQAIKDAIMEGTWVPNSPMTIARKGSDRPLIDTAHMINATTYVVRDKSK